MKLENDRIFSSPSPHPGAEGMKFYFEFDDISDYQIEEISTDGNMEVLVNLAERTNTSAKYPTETTH